MCSVIGYFKLNKESETNEDFFKFGFDFMRHRGPDYEKIELIDNICSLGHQRLSIVDISNKANQPMCFNNKLISYNGEVYNYKELNTKFNLNSKSDTEVFLKMFDMHDILCLNHFNGMFSAAIYDKNLASIILIRDRFGVKPLYYTIENEILYFASEMKPLIKIKKQLNLNNNYINNYCNDTASDYGENTFIEDIFQVEKGTYITVKANKLTKNKWYNGQDFYFDENIFVSKEKTIDFVENLLLDAIKIRLDADVPISMTLSGGIDSSLIYTLIKEKLKCPIKVFSYLIPDSPADESTLVKKLTNKYNDEFIEIKANKNIDIIDSVTEGLNISEFPIWNVSYSAYLKTYNTIHKHKYKVVIEGHGSDEFLAGYEFMHDYIIYDYLKNEEFVKAMEVLITMKKTSNFNLLNNTNLKNSYKKILKAKNRDKNNFISFIELREKIINYSILPIALRGFDRFSMAHSVESRAPFLDYRLVEVFKKLPPQFILNKIGNKAILRELLKKYKNDFIYKNKVKIGFCEDMNNIFRSQQNIKKIHKLFNEIKITDIEQKKIIDNALEVIAKDNLNWSDTFVLGKAIMLSIFFNSYRTDL